MKTNAIREAAEIVATNYAANNADQYGILWLKSRAAVLGYATEITKRGPRSLYSFRPFDGDGDATAPAVLPRARELLDILPNRLPGFEHLGEPIGRHPNPTALLDRLLEQFTALAAAALDDDIARSLLERVPLAAKA